MIANANLIVQHAIPIKNGIMTNVKASIKSIICTKRIILGILPHIICENSWY